MKILVVGSGGREHALAWKLSQSPRVEQVFCAPGNAGTAAVGENVPIRADQLEELVAFARGNGIGLTVIGPDDALAAGLADRLMAAGLRVFGPTQSAARLESSKIFAKELMRQFGIPTARAGTFESSADAVRFAEELPPPVVIKADGLALGKGVVIATDHAKARAAIHEMMEERKFGDAGSRIVVEEFLRGTECSVHAFVSGASYRPLATARDHKRALDGDHGPNTGGMGAVSPADNWSDEIRRRFDAEVMQPLLTGLARERIDFRGLLFPGLMITATGPKVLEFNCRFGDPETQAILPRLQSDLLDLLEATIDGTLDQSSLTWAHHSVTVVMASGGYPGKYETGKPISGLEAAAKLPYVHIFHAGTRNENGTIVTAGGRVLAVTALGNTVEEARRRAYEAVALISFDGAHFRRDIAVAPGGGNIGGL